MSDRVVVVHDRQVVKVRDTATVLRVVRVPERVVVTPPAKQRVTVVREPQRVVVRGLGLQGPPGPPGSGGGGSAFTHVQSTPAATWIIHHNLGRRVQVTLFDDSFNEIETDVVQGDLNTATATFAVPVTGSAVLG